MKKPVLLVLHPRDWARSEYGKNSLFDIHHVSIGGEVPRKISGAVTYDGYAEAVSSEGLQDLFETCERIKPDFFLFWLHSSFVRSHLDRIREIVPNVKMLFWFGNHRTILSKNVTNISKHIDMLFLNSKERSQFSMYNSYGIKRVACMYDGFNPAEIDYSDDTTTHDCFFAGESYVEAANKNPVLNFPGTKMRREFVLRCAERFKTLVCCARKDSWPFPTHPEVYHPEHTGVMRRAEITLNVNHFPDFERAYTRRTIRSIFAKRCHITLYIPGMERDFDNHKHLVWFYDIEEGLEQIAYYLSHPEKREAIAQAGFELACQKFTFEQSLQQFERDVRKAFPEKFK